MNLEIPGYYYDEVSNRYFKGKRPSIKPKESITYNKPIRTSRKVINEKYKF